MAAIVLVSRIDRTRVHCLVTDGIADVPLTVHRVTSGSHGITILIRTSSYHDTDEILYLISDADYYILHTIYSKLLKILCDRTRQSIRLRMKNI